MRQVGLGAQVGSHTGCTRALDQALDSIYRGNWTVVDPAGSAVSRMNLFRYPTFTSGDCVSWRRTGVNGEGVLDVVPQLLRRPGQRTTSVEVRGPHLEQLGNLRREPDNGCCQLTAQWMRMVPKRVLIEAIRPGGSVPWEIEATTRHSESDRCLGTRRRICRSSRWNEVRGSEAKVRRCWIGGTC